MLDHSSLPKKDTERYTILFLSPWVAGSTVCVRRGMAWVYVRYAAKGSPLYGLQAEAQSEHQGLWADPRPVAPWEWRENKR